MESMWSGFEVGTSRTTTSNQHMESTWSGFEVTTSTTKFLAANTGTCGALYRMMRVV